MGLMSDARRFLVWASSEDPPRRLLGSNTKCSFLMRRRTAVLFPWALRKKKKVCIQVKTGSNPECRRLVLCLRGDSCSAFGRAGEPVRVWNTCSQIYSFHTSSIILLCVCCSFTLYSRAPSGAMRCRSIQLTSVLFDRGPS